MALPYTDRRRRLSVDQPCPTPSPLPRHPARAEAMLAMHCTGIHALARLLANSEAFRDVQANCQTVEPGHWPLNGHITAF